MKTSKQRAALVILLALVWAGAFIASAIVFKGHPMKDWIQAALYIVGMSFWLWPIMFTPRRRC